MSAVIVFQDTFSGPAGPLTSHTPDVNDAGGAWTFSNGAFTPEQTDQIFALDGNGNLELPVDITTTVFIDIEPGDITDKIVTLTVTMDMVGNGGRYLIGFGNDDFRGIDQRSVGPVMAYDSGASMTVFNPGGLSTEAFAINPVLNQVNDFSTVSIAFNTSDNSFEISGDHDDPAFQNFSGSIDPSSIYALFGDPSPSGVVEFDYLYLQFNSPGNPFISELVVDVSDIPTGVFGDYNGDDVVNLADYTVWRNNLGASLTLPNEDPSVTPGQVTVEDYEVWKTFFGQSANAALSSSLANSSVPEPTAMLLALTPLLVGACRRHLNDFRA
ncbi:hypothetical protein NG895_23915 [Aeoliella sp. ICT_H6.2]|uniref:PEP-CTERM protein-sorting domain-containing protein n=1 Tax=Aeoliella straminimaris TaxID=2954799 RepID=A0A9X2FF88_9BACT|nr:hypothetical protein [Aeoliella straminimaris]